MSHNHYIPQAEGVFKDIVHAHYAESVEDAEDWFVEAKNRLLDINHWKDYGKTLNAAFQLTDTHGKEVNRRAHRGDYLHINVASPHASIPGHDWSVVEAIVYDDFPDENRESFAICLRPSADPHIKPEENNTAYVLDANATSTLLVERIGKRIAAVFHGPGEATNHNGHNHDLPHDINGNASLGLSEAQLSHLIKGLID